MTFVSKIEAHPTNTPDGAYPAGTVAVATVGGMKGVRIFLADPADTHQWTSAGLVEGRMWHHGDEVTDVRPLVVLDLERYVTRELLVTWLRQNPVCDSYSVSSEIANQIEAQSKPPRIPEPGWGGIVLSTGSGSHGEPMRWVRGDKGWTSLDATGAYLNWTDWSDLNDPTLIREGINA